MIMKIRGILVDILCELDDKYVPYVTYEDGKKLLYVHILKAIYGLLISAMLFYKKLVKDLTEFGFESNPYDPCVANKLVNGHQMTVSWHIDNLKISHIDPNEVTKFIEWIKEKYGSIGEVKATRGKIHEYFGMKLDYSIPGQEVTVDMQDYVTTMIEHQFPKEEALDGNKVSSPWNDNLFKVNEKSPQLNDNMREQFHIFV
jgi:hypothetical protein